MTRNRLDTTRAAQNLATFPPSVLEEVVLVASDLCVFVNEQRVVEDISRGGALEDLIGEHWIGQPLQKITRPDSWRKLDLLWGSQKTDAPLWRHLNFVANGLLDEDVPLLVRRVDAGNSRSILVCRDLRPSVRMQKNFSRVLLEMEQSFEDIRSVHQFGTRSLAGKEARGTTLQGEASGAVARGIGEIGDLPLADIISQTVRVMEDACIRLAYEECDYDLSKTAELLGISSDDLAKRIPFAPK